jgi:hypothetical protein
VVGHRSAVRANHHAESRVRTSPLRGTALGSTTSKALTRSVATINSASPRSYTSRTLPRTRSGKGRSVAATVAFRARAPCEGGCGARQGKGAGEARQPKPRAFADSRRQTPRRGVIHHARPFPAPTSAPPADPVAADVRVHAVDPSLRTKISGPRTDGGAAGRSGSQIMLRCPGIRAGFSRLPVVPAGGFGPGRCGTDPRPRNLRRQVSRRSCSGFNRRPQIP